MKTCPFCIGEIPDAAVKCRHCGEWVDGRRQGSPGSQPDPIGQAANRWVSNNTALGWAGFGLGVFVILFVFLPLSCQMRREAERFPQFPGIPGDIQRR